MDALNPDFFVTPSPSLTRTRLSLPRLDDRAAHGASTGSGEVQRMRQPRIDYRGTPLLFMATDVEALGVTSPTKAARRLIRTRCIASRRRARRLIGSENFASLNNLHAGDTVELQTPSGPLRLPLAGVVRDYSDQQGSVMVDLSVYRQYWNDDSMDFFRVYLHAGRRRVCREGEASCARSRATAGCSCCPAARCATTSRG